MKKAGGVHFVHFWGIGNLHKLVHDQMFEKFAAIERAVVRVCAETEIKERKIGYPEPLFLVS
jgi:hypothetical protein